MWIGWIVSVTDYVKLYGIYEVNIYVSAKQYRVRENVLNTTCKLIEKINEIKLLHTQGSGQRDRERETQRGNKEY